MKQALIYLILLCLSSSAEENTQTPFFAFLNGIPSFSSFDEEAKVLKELGYDGISQIFGGGDALTQRMAAYEKVGLKVLSIYRSANVKAIAPAALKALENRGCIIELTVPKITPEIIASIRQTTENASKMNIRVALYPHAGFAVATIPQAMELINQVNHPNLGIMFNLCHFLKNEKAEDLEKTLALCAPQLFAVSTSGADIDGKNWPTLIQTLDKGTFPQERLFRVLKKLNFEGPVSLQGYGIKGNKLDNITRSIRAWKALKIK
ncbi:TIM barrel protein [Lentisphaera profundi]|uniref:TIM barrel protein n=1 Tax=Lentisphaera profundi TaxID=1658616 RepID=A0ABY7W1D5_9BACT|nr:TIM barrel protein [Lentisphaera profundi]WDE99374.1 TIM barrel protein [Lentisphaera profundi]